MARTGTPELLHHIDEALFDQMSSQGERGEPDARMIADKLEPSSAVTVPLRTKDGLVGAMQFITSEAGTATTRTTLRWPMPSPVGWPTRCASRG